MVGRSHSLVDRLSDLCTQLDDLLALKEAYDDLQGDLQRLRDQYDELDNQNDELHDRYDQLQADYDALVLEHHDLETAYRDTDTLLTLARQRAGVEDK